MLCPCRREVKLRVNNTNGVLTTFALKGDGTGEVTGGSDFSEVTLNSTNEKTKLVITTKGRGLRASVGNITVNGSLNSIIAKTTDLVGAGIVVIGNGYVKSIQLHDIRNGADIVIPGDGSARGVTIKAGSLGNDTDIILGSYLKSLVLTEWKSGLLKAPWISSISIKGNKKQSITGDFGADVTLSEVNSKGYILCRAKIAGEISGTWHLTGASLSRIGTIKAGSTAMEWELDTQGYVASIYIYKSLAGNLSAKSFGKIHAKGDLTADINANSANTKGVSISKLYAGSVSNISLNASGGIKTIKVSKWNSGEIQAAWISTLQTSGNRRAGIRGDFSANVTLSGVDAPKNIALKSIKVANDLTNSILRINGSIGRLVVVGTVRNTTVHSTANIGRIILGATIDSDFLAGFDLDFAQRHPTNIADFTFDCTIKSIKVKGLKTNKYGVHFVNSNFSAATIGTASLVNVGNWNSGEGFGFWAKNTDVKNDLKSISHKSTVDESGRFTWKQSRGDFSNSQADFFAVIFGC